MFSVNTLRGPAIQKMHVFYAHYLFSICLELTAPEIQFFRARPKYFLLKHTIGHQETELCYIQYPPRIEFLWICRDPLMILTKFALSWNISHEVDVPRQGQIKISQLDNKTSLDLAISRIRTWGASSTTFFLELGEKYFSVVNIFCVIDRLMGIMLDIRQSVSSWRGETWNDSQGWEILKMKKTSESESNRTRTTCDWWCERRRALGDHQDQAVVDQVDHPGIT